MVRAVMFAAVLLFAASPAAAGGFYDKDQLAKVLQVLVVVEDDVRGVCLPQPDALKVEAELILRRSGINVVEKDLWARAHTLQINVNGTQYPRNTPGCIVAFSAALWRYQQQVDGTIGLVLAAESNTLIGYHLEEARQRLREKVNEQVTALANEILKVRQR